MTAISPQRVISKAELGGHHVSKTMPICGITLYWWYLDSRSQTLYRMLR